MSEALLSAAKFIPKSDSPRDIREAFERQAIWIEGQSRTNQSHWQAIQDQKRDCNDCRGDRKLVEEMLDQRLTLIQSTLDRLQGGMALAKYWTPLMLTVLSVFIAAKSVGFIK